jgi:hypothetical protein
MQALPMTRCVLGDDGALIEPPETVPAEGAIGPCLVLLPAAP